MFKQSLLAATITLALIGCGSDSNSGSNEETTTSYQFIDSAVEGLSYTTSSGLNGVTDSEGNFNALPNDSVTFYIGGPDGVKVGAASVQEVVTPFEAAGKYNRAINLAVLLQSVNNQFGSSGSGVLTIPEKLQDRDDQQVADALVNLRLDNISSVETFLTEIGVAPTNIVTDAEAIAHMSDSFGEMVRGDVDTNNPFAQGGHKHVRYIDVTQYKIATDLAPQTFTYVHADKTLPIELFEKTRGMTSMDFTLDSENVVMLAGSNDTSLSESKAEDYLNCLAAGHNFVDESCDGIPDENYSIIKNGTFAYQLQDPEGVQETNEPFPWDEFNFGPFQASTISELNHFNERVRDDKDDGDINSAWQRETISGAYDPITGIYTEITNKTKLNGDSCDLTPSNCTDGRNTQTVAFYYPVDDAGSERYVNFEGEWVNTQICADNSVAKESYSFSESNVTISGSECQNGTAQDNTHDEPYTYEDLANIDYWWFNQTGRQSQATLTELNTVVRFCDQDDYVQGDVCSDNKEYFVKWEYQPAGTDWDQGLLIRTKKSKSGQVVGRSIMQKVSS